jgi:zinc/manganese transport system substrate-binding protein
MKRILIIVLLFVVAGAFGDLSAGGKIKVVASSLDMADFVRQVGGDRVEVYAIFRGRTDMHFFEPIPSQVMKLKAADMLVVAGLDGDAWVGALIDASRNSRIRFGATGYVDPSDGIRPIQVPEGRIDGAMGHVHPYGNPHYWFTPENAAVAVNNIYDGLVRLSPGDEPLFRENRDAYLGEIERTFEELKEKMAPFAGTAVVEYHQSWDYFCGFFGLEVVATLEPKPGIPPSGKHLAEVVRMAKSRSARLMLVEPYYPEKPVRRVSEETGIETVRIPIYLGTMKGIDSYLDLLRYNVKRIVKALS